MSEIIAVGIPSIFGLTNAIDTNYKDEGILLGNAAAVNFIGEGVEATLNAGVLTVNVESNGGGKGFVAITDINATNPSDNVGSKVKTDDDNVLQSCTSSTNNVTVSVLAVTGKTSFKPTVTVNGIAATLVRNALTDVWQGSAAITLTNSTVTALHNDGATDTATVTIEAAPVISALTFSGAYPNALQTEHAQGQTLSLTIVSNIAFTELQVIDDNVSVVKSATEALSTTFSATTSKTITVTVADRGNIAPQVLPAKVRIKSVNGTWSTIYASSDFGGVNGTHVIALNNVRPVVTFGAITYPASQTALKSSESATVAVTTTNADSIAYTSTGIELYITDPSDFGTKTVTRSSSASYNITTPNLQAQVSRVANATTANFETVIWIAQTTPPCAITVPAARLRSSPSGLDHTVTLTFSQRVASPTLTASVGAWQGAWATDNNGVTWTRSLRITDALAKGAATFSALSTTNLANIAVSTITSGASYTVGGFVARTVTMAATPNREVLIGTLVVDTAKLLVTNFSKGGAGVAMAYQGSTADGVDKFTITGTNTLLYNCDAANAGSNFSGTAQFSIEETVA